MTQLPNDLELWPLRSFVCRANFFMDDTESQSLSLPLNPMASLYGRNPNIPCLTPDASPKACGYLFYSGCPPPPSPSPIEGEEVNSSFPIGVRRELASMILSIYLSFAMRCSIS